MTPDGSGLPVTPQNLISLAERVQRLPLDQPASARAARRYWDSAALEYLAEHRSFLHGDDANGGRFVWGPEGLTEPEAGLLGNLAGLAVLELGCGSAPCSVWLASQGAHVVGLDLSAAMLRAAQGAVQRAPAGPGDAARPGEPARQGSASGSLALLQADAAALPLAASSMDLVCSSYGAMPFVADASAVLRGIWRVLRPGGRLVFSVTHPIRWCFVDDPGEDGLVAVSPYWDRRPYVELDELGDPEYVEHHRTIGDWVRAVHSAGLVLVDLVEPEWPISNQAVWGGWSPTRGEIIPGTAILSCRKPASQ